MTDKKDKEREKHSGDEPKVPVKVIPEAGKEPPQSKGDK